MTHAHPDHYGGLGIFTESAPSAPVYSAQMTHDIIASDALGFSRATVGGAGSDFPCKPVAPTTITHDGQRLEIDGVFETFELGAGEASSMTAIVVPAAKAAFVGDAAADHVTPFLVQGMSLSWLGQLDVLEARRGSPSTLYPGHGAPGSPVELVSSQRSAAQRERCFVTSWRKSHAEARGRNERSRAERHRCFADPSPRRLRVAASACRSSNAQ